MCSWDGVLHKHAHYLVILKECGLGRPAIRRTLVIHKSWQSCVCLVLHRQKGFKAEE